MRPFLIVVLLALTLTACGASRPSVVERIQTLTSDPRYDHAFYQLFAVPLGYTMRQTSRPDIWVNTHDDAGTAIPHDLLTTTGANAHATAHAFLSGTLEVGGLHYGEPPDPKGTITIRWKSGPSPAGDNACGNTRLGANSIDLHYLSPCRCGESPTIRPTVAKHEIGHALGFGHSDLITDLMHISAGGDTRCDLNPSERELFHARVAYAWWAGRTP